MTCNHSQESIYIACVYCDIEHATITERERIISLLNHEYWHNVSYLSDIHYDCLMCEAITLIGGES